MKFHYKAQSKIGVVIEDTIEAESKEAVIAKIRENGATPVFVEEKGNKSLNISIPFIDNLIGGINLQDKVIFAKNLARMLNAGLSTSRALRVLKKQTTKESFRVVLDHLIADINNGESLSDGLAKYPKVFSPMFIAMVHAGEESGNIVGNLLEISAQLDKTSKLRKKIKGAMIYPGVILSAMVIIGVLMFIFVVPTLLATFKSLDMELPASTQLIIFLSDSIQAHTFLFLVSIVGFFAGLITIFRLKSMEKYIDFIVLKIPVTGTIAIEMNTAIATRTLSSLLESGLSISRALTITKEVLQNTHYKKSLEEGIKSIEKGGQLSKIFEERKDLYPVMMGEMVEVGEETGKLVDMLKDVADFYEYEVDSKTKNLSTIIEPVLMLLIGSAVGFFAVSIMSPMYSVLEGIS
ncbi:type II secretion system F family protein [Candidatus Parcubacteria bacterium]|nr:type II secretion system F family protein [Candidatus Parcubacteria bacterium]